MAPDRKTHTGDMSTAWLLLPLGLLALAIGATQRGFDVDRFMSFTLPMALVAFVVCGFALKILLWLLAGAWALLFGR